MATVYAISAVDTVGTTNANGTTVGSAPDTQVIAQL